jgi:hypothetical protein
MSRNSRLPPANHRANRARRRRGREKTQQKWLGAPGPAAVQETPAGARTLKQNVAGPNRCLLFGAAQRGRRYVGRGERGGPPRLRCSDSYPLACSSVRSEGGCCRATCLSPPRVPGRPGWGRGLDPSLLPWLNVLSGSLLMTPAVRRPHGPAAGQEARAFEF